MRAVRFVLMLVLALPLSMRAADFSLIVSGQWLERTGESDPGPLREAGTFVDYDFDVGGGLGVGLLWEFSERWALETKASWGLMEAQATIVSPDAIVILNLGDLDVVPLTAVLQWRPDLEGDWDPYVGVGGAHIFFGSLALSEGKVEFDDDTALVLNAGLDVALSERWFINGDVKYLPIETGVEGRSSLGPSADIGFEPLIASAGVRYRF
jgi:outer membrane protein W